MKQNRFLPITILLLAIAAFTGCKKTTEPSGFTWVYNGTSYTARFKKAYLYSMSVGPVIIGGTGTSMLSPGAGPSIYVNSLSVGSYYFGTGSPNYVGYVDAQGNALISSAGSLDITSNTGSSLSGKFTGTISNTANAPVPLTISFTNIPIEN